MGFVTFLESQGLTSVRHSMLHRSYILLPTLLGPWQTFSELSFTCPFLCLAPAVHDRHHKRACCILSLHLHKAFKKHCEAKS